MAERSATGPWTRLLSPRTLLLLICLITLLATAAIAWFVFEGIPHVEDEVAYLFQAKVFALGRLYVPTPPYGEEAFWIPFVLDVEGRRFSKYPPGFPLLLAVGVRLGADWLVNPVLAGLLMAALFGLGRSLYDNGTGLLAAALGATSPLFLVLAGTHMAHVAAALALTLFAWLYVRTLQGDGRATPLLAGLALGMAILIRPLTAFGIALPFALHGLVRFLGGRRAQRRRLLILALAALPAIPLYLLYNYALVHRWMLSLYTLWWPYDRIGFGPGHGWREGGHTPAIAYYNALYDLGNLATELLGWPRLSWLFLPVALLLPPWRRRDGALLLPPLSLVLVQSTYWIASGSLFGPRYQFEGSPFLWLLTAVGVRKLWALGRPAGMDRTVLHRGRAALRPLLVLLLLGLVLINLTRVLPPKLARMQGLYGVTRRPLEAVQATGLRPVLVIVRAERWLEYGALLTHNDPLLRGEIVTARDSGPEVNAGVIAAFPGRHVLWMTTPDPATGPVLSLEPPP